MAKEGAREDKGEAPEMDRGAGWVAEESEMTFVVRQ